MNIKQENVGRSFVTSKKITNILNGLKIENYDLTSVFCDQNEPKELFYKFDPMHLSENGHKIVYKEIKKRKLK